MDGVTLPHAQGSLTVNHYPVTNPPNASVGDRPDARSLGAAEGLVACSEAAGDGRRGTAAAGNRLDTVDHDVVVDSSRQIDRPKRVVVVVDSTRGDSVPTAVVEVPVGAVLVAAAVEAHSFEAS